MPVPGGQRSVVTLPILGVEVFLKGLLGAQIFRLELTLMALLFHLLEQFVTKWLHFRGRVNLFRRLALFFLVSRS